MNSEFYLNFLKENLPFEHQWERDIVSRATGYFYEYPCEGCLPLLIQSMQYIDSISESVQVIFKKFPNKVVSQYIFESISEGSPETQFWCMDSIRFYPEPRFLPYIKAMLGDRVAVRRMAAAVALEAYPHEEAQPIAKLAYSFEQDEEVREILEDMI